MATTKAQDETQDATATESKAVDTKLRDEITKEFYQTGRARKGYSIRFETSGGQTRPVVEKVG